MPNATQTTSQTAPAWALPYWGSYLNGASQLSQRPYQRYTGTRVADFSPEEYEGMGRTMDRARAGSPLLRGAQSSLQGMFGGGSVPMVQAQGAVSTRRNPLLDSNAHLDDIIRRTGADTSRDYATGTAAQNDARAARARAFGGSAYEETNRRNAESLADRLAGNASGLRYGDFNDRRQLEESAIGREHSSAEAAAARNLQAQMSNQGAAGARDSRALQAIGMAPGLAEADYADADRMMGVGGLRRMYSQNLADQRYGDWREERDYPQQQTDWFGNAIGRAAGNQGTSTSSTSQPSSSAGNWLGAGLGAAALWNMFR